MNNIVGDNMIETEILKKRKYHNILTMVLCVAMLAIIGGISYAFFVYNKDGVYTHTITGGKIRIMYNEDVGNNIHIENAYPITDEQALYKSLEFEFSVTGYNEGKKNVYYAIEMVHGEDIVDKNRFLDTDIKISLYENDELVVENMIFDNLDKQDIYYGQISSGTSSETPDTKNYKMRIWINDNVIITDTPDTFDSTGKKLYSTTEFANSYANFRVNVRTNLTYEDVGYLTYDARGGSNTPKKTSVTTGKVTMEKPVMEGLAFMGWSTTPDDTVEYKPGDSYSGEGRVLYAVYDIINVMYKLTAFTDYVELNRTITEVYFINDTQENIDARYDASDFKVDLTYNNQGSVKGWIETDDDTSKVILYIGSEGTIYLSTGANLFRDFSALTTIDFGNVNTSLVTSTKMMFMNCTSLTTLDLSNFDTSSVNNMWGMFDSCSSLTTIYCDSDWNADYSSDMFDGCTSLVGAIPFDSSKTDGQYANPDTGYFTRKTA